MKFLIDNYSSPYNTEALYLSTSINLIDGCESSIYQQDKKISVYDMFDAINPNVFITRGSFISSDTISYLRENKNNIHLLINISSVNQEQLSKLESILDFYNIKPVLFFINYANHNLTSKTYNIFVLPHSADIFLGKNASINYRIDSGIFITAKSQIIKREGTYHYISLDSNLIKDVDIAMSAMYLANIYKNYNKLIFKPFTKIVPQYFYDAIFYGNEVVCERDDESGEALGLMKAVLGDMDPKTLKSVIKNKHTCLHRTKSLLSQLPCNDIVLKLGKIIGDTKWE